MVKKMMISLWAVVLLTGCEKLDLTGLVAPASAEADQRVHESLDINAREGVRNFNVSADTYRFYACADVHTEVYPYRYAEVLRRQEADSAALFGLLLGDISNRKGAIHSIADVVAGFSKPVMALVGNHDLFFDQWGDFKNRFGSSTYYFTVTTPHYRDLYIMLDSGGGCHGQTQMKWLRDVLKDREKYRHCVVCSHVNIFRTDLSQFVSGNLPLEETYELMDLLSANHVDLYLQGHDHHRKETVYGGVRYMILDCLKDAASYVSYFVFDVSDGFGLTVHDDL